ncbi:MAG: hypothetical protein R3A78_04155 [Polyangiales bacterium]
MSDLASDLAQFDASFGSDWAVADKRKIAEAFIIPSASSSSTSMV